MSFKCGNTPWNKGKTGVYSEETLKKMSDSKKGKHFSPETQFKKGHTPWLKNNVGVVKHTEENNRVRSERMKGEGNHFYGKKHAEETRKLMRERHYDLKERWKNPEFKERMLKAQREGMNVCPNKPEQAFIDICKKHNLPYKFVGDGEFMLGGKNPDFINVNGKKEVVEIFGRAFHSPLETFREDLPYHQTYKGCIEHYKQYGFNCIIIWDDEIGCEDLVLRRLGGL